MSTTSLEPHLSVKMFAAALGVSPRVVRHLIDKGALPAKKIGREYRIRLSVALAYGETAYSRPR